MKKWILLNKKIIHSYLKCIVYDKLLKPRQSFWITRYNEGNKNLNLSNTKLFNMQEHEEVDSIK
jgi:hypothetical protein